MLRPQRRATRPAAPGRSVSIRDAVVVASCRRSRRRSRARWIALATGPRRGPWEETSLEETIEQLVIAALVPAAIGGRPAPVGAHPRLGGAVARAKFESSGALERIQRLTAAHAVRDPLLGRGRPRPRDGRPRGAVRAAVDDPLAGGIGCCACATGNGTSAGSALATELVRDRHVDTIATVSIDVN